MNTKTVTAQNCSLFEIDAELEEAFDQERVELGVSPYRNMSEDDLKTRIAELEAKLGLVRALPPVSGDSKPNEDGQ